MDFRSFSIGLALRLGLLLLPMAALSYGISLQEYRWIVGSSILILVITIILFRYILRRIKEMSYFFESIKYRDFSRQFSEEEDSPDIIELHKGFNNTIDTIKEIHMEKETQFLFLQKILEIIDSGIICFDLENGQIIWMNSAFRNILDIPSVKNINFIEKRYPLAFEKLFSETTIRKETLAIPSKNESLNYLMSNATFIVQNRKYKLIAIQDIELNLNQNETDAWKKLLSVMTHEIMNSIAPISSLAETLRNNVRNASNGINMEDLAIGIESIKNRSEGLLRFAQTYRSLNKITHINSKRYQVHQIFSNVRNLLIPSLSQKGIDLKMSETELDGISVEVDKHLIEQVLINLIINAVEAFPDQEIKSIVLSASQNLEGRTELSVTDNGTGIPEDIRSQIFIPFFTTKKQGNGIGLSLCKQIMTLHKGQIQIQSVDKKGTRVKLLFAP